MAILCKNLNFGYSSSLLKDVNFELEKGSVGVLVGRSGSGKSTLFQLLTGELKPVSGSVHVFGNLASCAKEQISFMTHQDLLLPWRSVLENILLPAELVGCDITEFKERAIKLLERVGLKESIYSYPTELSQGMRQRVALVRTLLLKRPLILLDEPFGALDLVTRRDMYQLVQELVKEEGSSLLMITHDLRDCGGFADRLFLIRSQSVVELPKSCLEVDSNSRIYRELLHS